MINRNMKWNDYPSDTLYLWNGNTVFRISEGTGENFWPEDEEAGYKDYWMTEYYTFEDGNGGQWMETELIKDIDYTINGVLERLYDCDLWEDDWKIIDEDLGEELCDLFEKYWEAERVKKEIDKLTEQIK